MSRNLAASPIPRRMSSMPLPMRTNPLTAGLLALWLSACLAPAQLFWFFSTVNPSNPNGMVLIISGGSGTTGGHSSGNSSAPPPPLVCTYVLGATSANLGGALTADTIRVSAPGGCAWIAQSSAAWIHTSSAGSGDGWADYVVEANPTGALRTGTLTVAGQRYTVTQAPQGYLWHDVFGWLYRAGNGWHHADGLGWLWFDSGGNWIWSTALQGWISITDYRARQAWTTQYGWVTFVAGDASRMVASTLGPLRVGRSATGAIPAGWVLTERFGYLWPGGDAQWFYSDQLGWLAAGAEGAVWCAAQGRWL